MIIKLFYNKYFQNFFFISLYQAVNFLALIIFIPLLITIIGHEKFGLIAVMQAICSFFFILVDYGFSATAVRKLSIFRNDINQLETIIKNTIGAKIFLLIIAFPLFIILPLLFLRDQYSIYFVFLSFFSVIGQAAFPAWLCQGLEENKILFYANFINKIILFFLIYYFIEQKEEFGLFLFFTGVASTISGIILTMFIFTNVLKVPFKMHFSVSGILEELNEGKELFLSNFSMGLSFSSNVLILALFISPSMIGIYSIGERLLMLLRTLLGVFVQALYPYVCRLVYQISYKEIIHKVFNFTLPFIIFIVFLCILMYFFSMSIASFFTKENIFELSIIIEKLSFLPVLVSLNIVPNLVILANKKEKLKSYILLISTLCGFILSFLFVPFFKIDGTICIMYIIEVIISISSIVYMFRLEKVLPRFNIR